MSCGRCHEFISRNLGSTPKGAWTEAMREGVSGSRSRQRDRHRRRKSALQRYARFIDGSQRSISIHHLYQPLTSGPWRASPRRPAIAESEVLMATTLTINGERKSFEAPADMPLLWVLRDVLGMTGTKFGCGVALCGACTVHIDGQPVRSCMLPVDSVGKAAITTIEAIGDTPSGRKIQNAWLDLDVVQCGYCQSGQIMSASALLA